MIEQQYNAVCYLQFPSFAAFPEVIHGVFTRAGGCSPPPYQGLNASSSLRDPDADHFENVVHNRQLVIDALGLKGSPCVSIWQVHGADVKVLERADEWRTDWACTSYYSHAWTPEMLYKGDALITREEGIGLALSFADCTPLLFYDPVGRVIGVAHGGWRGTARGVAIATVGAMCDRFGCQPGNIYAGIGPTIGPCCYEVSEEVRNLFLGRAVFDTMPTDKAYSSIVREAATFSLHQLADRESLRLDLAETNRQQLLMMGLLPGHIEVSGICTCCTTRRFFSHRGEGGRTGRFPIVIALQPEHVPETCMP